MPTLKVERLKLQTIHTRCLVDGDVINVLRMHATLDTLSATNSFSDGRQF